MTVQAARVQAIVKGDDVSLTHQILKKVALNAEVVDAACELASTDKVTFFYELEDGTIDLIGYDGVVVDSYPSSIFTVAIPGVIAETLSTPERGSKTFKHGEALTVRAEITRDFAGLNPIKETHYLLKEVDIFERGFPVEQEETELP